MKFGHESFKVIGVGPEAAYVIDKIKALDYDCAYCMIAASPDDCFLTDDDKMAIVVAVNNVKIANKIAKKYKDADVLTIGLLYDADPTCYDTVITDVAIEDFPNIIKSLILPVASTGYCTYDFYNLYVTLRDTRYFTALIVEGNDIENISVKSKKSIEDINIAGVEYISGHLFFKRHDIKLEEISYLFNILFKGHKAVVFRSVNIDDSLSTDMIRFAIILSGKKLR